MTWGIPIGKTHDVPPMSRGSHLVIRNWTRLYRDSKALLLPVLVGPIYGLTSDEASKREQVKVSVAVIFMPLRMKERRVIGLPIIPD